jgi:hypothetical protein
MKKVHSYDTWISINESAGKIAALVDQFVDSDAALQSMDCKPDRWMKEHGWCSTASDALSDYLENNGIKGSKPIVVKFDQNLSPEAPPYNEGGDYHTALVVGGKVVDITIGQFTGKPEKFIGSVSAWISKLQSITRANPKIVED